MKKVAKVRRAKLNFLRGRRGKSARINERFTSSDEFSVAAAPVVSAVVAEEEIVAVASAAPAKQDKAPEVAKRSV